MVGQLANVDPKLAERVANGLGLDRAVVPVPTKVQARTDLKPSTPLSILAKAKPTVKGRMVGCLVADGTDPALVTALKAHAQSEGAKLKVVAPKVQGAKGANGQMIPADFQLAGGPSVLFDAVVIAASATGAQQLAMQTAAVAWVQDAFSHLKVIGYTASAKPLLDKAGVMPDRGIVAMTGGSNTFLAEAAKGRVWEREPKVRMVV